MTSEEEEYCSPDRLLFRTRGNKEEEDQSGQQLTVSEMVFIVVQICTQCKVIKSWYGCVVPDQVTLADFYHQSKKIVKNAHRYDYGK